jgi:hypothetical protein
MSHETRNDPSAPDLLAPLDDEGSAIRPRDGAQSGRGSEGRAPEVRAPANGAKRSHSSTRPAVGSLDDRLEKKMRLAAELLRHLPASDARARLIQVAVMRRDETLLDGVLAELNKTAAAG